MNSSTPIELLIVQEPLPDGLAVSKTVQVIVEAINDAPVIEAPHRLIAEEDTQISVVDVRIEDTDCDETPRGVLEVTIASSNGTITFQDSVAGLYLMEISPKFLKIRGKPAPISAAMAGLSYVGEAEFNGNDVVTITADDLGNSGEGGPLRTAHSINILVTATNDPPRLIVPANVEREAGGTLFVDEDTGMSMGDFGVVDPDDDTVIVRFSVRFGTLHTAAVGNGDSLIILLDNHSQQEPETSSISFEGATEDVSAALMTLTYKGPVNWNSAADDRDLVKVSRHKARVIFRNSHIVHCCMIILPAY